MAQQVGHALLQRRQILMIQGVLGQAAVHLQRPDSGYHHHGGGGQPGGAALDVQELLRPQVSAEAGLGDGVLAGAQGHPGSQDAVTAVSNVGEGAAVDKGGGALQGLHQVGLDGLLQEGGHGPLGVELAASHRLAGEIVAHHDAAQPLFQVGDGAGQAQHRHDLAGHGDVKAVLPGHAVGPAAHAVHDEAQLPVVHIQAALPGDAPHVDAQGVALLNVVIQHGGQQVVGRADGVDIPGEVEVDVLHGHHLGIAAAAGPALDAEHRPQGGLPHGHHGLLADAAQAVGQTDGGGGLALAGGGGGDGGHQHQLALAPGAVLQQGKIHLGLVAAILFQILVLNMGLFGDLADGPHAALLGNFNIAEPSHKSLSSPYLKYSTAAENICMS